MANKKYTVMANRQFLGHYAGKTAAEAVEKAIKDNYDCHDTIIGMYNCSFVATKNGKDTSLFSWVDFSVLAQEYGISA